MAKKNCGCGQDPCVTFGAEMSCNDQLNEAYEWIAFHNGEENLRRFMDSIGITDAETFDAPYAGSGSLFSVGSSDSLSGLSSKELTESSAIHGDFDSASLNYSGHQNLQVRAETFEAEELECCEGEMEFRWATTNGDALFRCPECGSKKVVASNLCPTCTEPSDECVCAEMGWGAETFESMSWYDPGEDTNNLERAFRREYPRYTLDSSSMEYLIYQGGASNKFHIFFVAVDDGGQYHAFNAYGRIGYNPRIQYIGGPYSTFDSAEYAFKKKMGQKTKKGYRPFGAEGSGSISAYTTIPYSWETDPDPHEHDEHIDNYDIDNAIEYEVDSEVRSGNRSGYGTYTTTVGYDDPEDEGSWVQEDLDIDYRWGAEGSSEDDIPQVELHNPIETGIKLSIGSMIAVVGLSAIGGAVLGLLNRTMGDE